MPPAHQAAQLHDQLPRGELVIAVDTGGTKTAACLVEIASDNEHRLLGQARTSAGNPLSVGFERASQAIYEAFLAARELANCGERQVNHAVLSIAGAANPALAHQFGQWAVSVGMAKRVAVVSDVLPILAAGTPDCCGVALIAGTGSSAFGRSADGRTKRCGGWGYLLGDEGSGYAIGRAALKQALHVLETGVAAKGLAQAVLSALGVKAVAELTRAVYTAADPRHTIAALAPLVSSAAVQGDGDACQILAEAAACLAKLAARTAAAIGIEDSGFPLALSGGILINSPQLQELLHNELKLLKLNCTTKIVSEPLVGCIALAQPRYAETLVQWHSASCLS